MQLRSTLMQAVAALAVFAIAHDNSASAATTTYASATMHTDKKCTSTPQYASFSALDNCTYSKECTNEFSNDESSSSSSSIYYEMDCTTDLKTAASDIFGGAAYLLAMSYSDESCTTESDASAFLADGTCLNMGDSDSSMKFEINANGSVTQSSYSDTKCETKDASGTITSDKLDGKTCSDSLVFYLATGSGVSIFTTTGSALLTAGVVMIAGYLS